MKSSIQTKMIVMLIVLIIIPISTLGIFSYNRAENILINELKKESFNNIKNVDDYYLNSLMTDIEKTVTMWSTEPMVEQSYISKGNEDAMMHQLYGFARSNPEIMWAYLGTTDGKFFLVPKDPNFPKNYDPRTRIWYKDAIEAKGNLVWTVPYADIGTHELTVTVAKAVYDPSNNNKLVGVFGVDLTLKRLSELVSRINLGDRGYAMMLDNTGNVITHPDMTMLGKNISNNAWVKTVLRNQSGTFTYKLSGKDVVISYVSVAKTDWKLIGIIPQGTFKKEVAPIERQTIWVVLMATLVAILLGIIFSKSVVDKIRDMINYMEEVEKGNLEIQSVYKGSDEFGELNEKFNTMALTLKETMDEIKILSVTDGLTGLYNHKYIHERLDSEIKRAKRYKDRLSIIMIDIDHFKEVNDTYGHQAGDVVLSAASEIVMESVREIDIVGRYGGEEFLIILPKTGLEEGKIVAERIRNNVEELEWPYEGVSITISAGVKELTDEDALELVRKADSLLYLAKKNGRNRVEV